MSGPTADRDGGYGRLVDGLTESLLADVGLPGFALAEAVDRDGVTSYWVVDRDQLGVDGADHGDEEPPHELAGSLPRRWQRQIDDRPSYCGAVTAAGFSCRIRVTAAGQRCRHHEQASAKEPR